MLDLSTVARLEKNKLASDGAWLILLEIQVSKDVVIRVVRNTEDVTWNDQEWVAFPFDMDEITEDTKELPQLTIRVSNVTRTLQQYLELADGGGVGATVILRVIHSTYLNSTTKPEVEETFIVQSVRSDVNWVHFTLGGDYPMMRRIPETRYLKDFCPFKYKGILCAATSTETECNKTLEDCRVRNNAGRFGGEPSIPLGGLYASNH